MNDAINRAVVRQARQIISIERWLLAISAASTVLLFAAAAYFEHDYGVAPYSVAMALVFFLGSLLCFRLLFSAMGMDFRGRGKKGTRALFTMGTAYVVAAAAVAYAVTFGLFGLPVPWAGDGRDYLYASYFLLSVAAVFLARSVVFYLRLRAYITQSLGHLSK